jgi:hypothetical protein
MRLCDVGWCWEGQGLDPGVHPSVLGIGDGCRFFGLRRANFMFHPNDDFALERLAWLDEVTCDIAKWRYKDSAGGGSEHFVDATPAAVRAEAELLGRLSLRHPNITGAFHDDLLGLLRREGMAPEEYGDIRGALAAANPALKLWAVVYTHELDEPEWPALAPFLDVITVWVWNAGDLRGLDGHIARCRERFPGKPLVMGAYLRDYPTAAPVPMELLRLQWETMGRHIAAGDLDGFTILAACLVDGHQEQARWVRDFIAANS